MQDTWPRDAPDDAYRPRWPRTKPGRSDDATVRKAPGQQSTALSRCESQKKGSRLRQKQQRTGRRLQFPLDASPLCPRMGPWGIQEYVHANPPPRPSPSPPPPPSSPVFGPHFRGGYFLCGRRRHGFVLQLAPLRLCRRGDTAEQSVSQLLCASWPRLTPSLIAPRSVVLLSIPTGPVPEAPRRDTPALR